MTAESGNGTIGVGQDVAPGTELPEGLVLGDGVRRFKSCLEQWPDAVDGEYNPACCRFPKSCSAESVRNRVYTDAKLEDVSDSDRANQAIGAYVGARGPALPDGTDKFLSTQQPDLTPVDDLSRFVLARIIELELEPRGEIDVFANPEQAMAYRYAKHVREDCVVFRRIVAEYLLALIRMARAGDDYEQQYEDDRGDGLRLAVLAVANRWSDHHEFRDEWRLG